MLKYVAPLERRLRSHLGNLPTLPARAHPTAVSHPSSDTEPTTGQLLAEHVAAIVGSWPFIIGQGIFLLGWFTLNVVSFVHHWDPYPWMAANILMSAEAAFTGPILLIAANVGAIRDHRQYDRIEHLVAQNEAMAERIATLETTILARLDALDTRTPSEAA